MAQHGSAPTEEIGQLTQLLHRQASAIDLRWVLVAIPLVGVGVSLFVWLGIEAARFSHTKLRTQWRRYRNDCGGLSELPLLAGGGSHVALALGYSAPRLIPWVFMVAWLFLITIRLDGRIAYGILYLVAIVWILYIISTVKTVIRVVDEDDEALPAPKREGIA